MTNNSEVIDMKVYSGKTAASSDFMHSSEIGLAMSRCGRLVMSLIVAVPDAPSK